MSPIKEHMEKLTTTLHSQRGRDTLMFLLFVAVSAVLWCVLSLNEEEQRDLRLPLRITHVPDSVTLISKGPEALNVSLRARGTQIMKMTMGGAPEANIDFRAYATQGILHLSNADLKAIARNATGGSQVSVVYPDTLSMPYTTHQGFEMPVSVDAKVTAGPQAAILGRPRLSVDTVRVYMAPGYKIPDGMTPISTEPIRLIDLKQTTTIRAKLSGPSHSRVIPDSVDITFDVEPMIFKSRKVVIEPVNVPHSVKLITFPAQIDAFFMVPMSAYSNGDIHFRVVADYRTINPLSGARRVKLKLMDVPEQLHNVQLSVDSAEYIIERH